MAIIGPFVQYKLLNGNFTCTEAIINEEQIYFPKREWLKTLFVLFQEINLKHFSPYKKKQ